MLLERYRSRKKQCLRYQISNEKIIPNEKMADMYMCCMYLIQSRELKSVSVDAWGQLVRLVFHHNHINNLNLYNQVYTCMSSSQGLCIYMNSTYTGVHTGYFYVSMRVSDASHK